MGDEFEQRFEIVSFAGAGGMGTVYRARDRLSGQLVALKVARPHSEVEAERFAREAEVLSQLSHPAVVRYVAHGAKSDGERYLATEWLEGENLGEHLRRERPGVEAALRFARRVADALGAAHRRGIIHRDVKPANLFLVGRSLDAVKILDFGIARLGGFARQTLTQTGHLLGTPGYMAPEQARGERGVDARADVFSLGCVLFKCLTGQTPFTGDDVLSVLVKLVLEEPPRASSLNGEVPGAVDDLVVGLMAKAPGERPPDGEAVVAAIDALAGAGHAESRRGGGLGTTERRIVCVALADLGEGGRDRALDPALARAVGRQGGALDVLADGSVLVSLDPGAAFTDQALRSARAARAVAAAAPGGKVALVAGRAEIAGRVPMGEVIDRAVALLRAHAEPGVVRVDALMADLLEGAFELVRDPGGAALIGERDERVGRTLMGRRTPFVGREREVATLEALFDEVASEPVARAALVTGAAGIGKSRLRDELGRRLAARDEPLTTWFARGDPMRTGAAFGLLGPMLRRALGVSGAEAGDVSWEKLRAAVEAHVEAPDAARVAVFVGELASVPQPGEASPQLRAARADPILLGDQMRRAFEDLAAGVCRHAALVVALEDVQWGDLPSLQFVDAALRNLHDRPLFVLATARPDVGERFPKLFAGRPLTELKLSGLTKKSSERLVRGVLGAATDAATVERIVAQAGGDAFYLEELIRSVADGAGDALPPTVLASVHARFDRLAPGVRRALRAASVFGSLFRVDGVAALLGKTTTFAEARAAIDELVDRELVQVQPVAAGPDAHDALAFRQELVRDAAYAMLTDADRALGHRLAGGFLEAAGERHAAVLADHFDRGGEPARALVWYERAAEQALAGNDLVAALEWCELAGGCAERSGARDGLGAVRLLAAEAHRWRGEFAAAEEAASTAVQLLPRRCSAWFVAAGEAAILSGRLGHNTTLFKIGDELLAAWAGDVSPPDQVVATSRTASILVMAGAYELADALIDRVRPLAASPDHVVAARVHQAIATRALVAGDPGTHLVSMRIAAERFADAGDERNACNSRVTVGFAQMDIGAYEPAEVALREALAVAERLGLPNLAAYAKHNLGLVLSRTGRVDEAARVEREAMDGFAQQGDKRLAGASRAYLGMILAQAGALADADAELERAVDELGSAPSVQVYALATLVTVRLAQGRVDEALVDARRAMALFDQLGGIEEGEALVRLAYAETLAAAGERAAAAAAIETARSRLLERAEKLHDPAFRTSFLERVPDHVRTLQLAREWLGT